MKFMAISPILAGAFTGVETANISFNPTNKNFLYGYYNIKYSGDRINHLKDLAHKFSFNLDKAKEGLPGMIKELIEDPFKYDKANENEHIR